MNPWREIGLLRCARDETEQDLLFRDIEQLTPLTSVLGKYFVPLSILIYTRSLSCALWAGVNPDRM